MLWDIWDLPWIETQLDDAVALGCNVVRIMGSLVGLYNGRYDRATYHARWAELNDACVDRGLRLYPCMQPGNASDGISGVPQAFLETEGAAWAALINGFQNAIGIDVVQENHAFGATYNGGSLLNVIRDVTDLPLTFSIVGGTPSQLGHADNTAAMTAIRFRVDFMDLHWYHNPTSTGIETYFWDAGYDMPFLVGEFGHVASAGQAAQEARFQAVKDTIAHAGNSGRRPAGALVWDLRDAEGLATSDQYGLRDEDGVTRAYLTAIFDQIPVI